MSQVGERELLAIIFTDAVDSTARTASDEDHSLRVLLADLDHIRTEAAVRGGTVLKNTGDGLLISFKSAVDAVECALSIQAGFASRSETSSFRHKVGVHIGDVVKKDGDIYGSGVNTASRLVAQCPAGGVCLSSTVYELVKQKSQIGSLPVENFQLTNMEPPIGAYRVRPPGDPGPALAPRRDRKTGQARQAVVLGVLGFVAVAGIGFVFWKKPSGSPVRPAHPNQGSPVEAAGPVPRTGEDWAPGGDPEAVATVYFKIWNLEMGEDLVLNCYNADDGRGRCRLFLNEAFKNQKGQLWDLRHPGSLRNSFLGRDRAVSIDPVEGEAFMGITGSPQSRTRMEKNPDGVSFKILVAGRYLSAEEPGRPGGNPRVWASRTDLGRKSDWALRPTASVLPGVERMEVLRRNPFGVTDVPAADPVQLKKVSEKLQAEQADQDANRPAWTQAGGPYDSIDGEWAGRWNGGSAGGDWRVGGAKIRMDGGKVYVLYADKSRYLIECERKNDFLTGSYQNLDQASDFGPWAGKIIDHGRIDGAWSQGRWDFRR